ncbi:MAG: radical SAM protein [Theionarchaea archaeon]|nr:radical SAM protein [Theionarchaea archaeon]
MMTSCILCGKDSVLSRALPVCLSCIRTHPEKALPLAEAVHRRIKREYAMPETPPDRGVPCGFCVNDCRIEEGYSGYCGVRRNTHGSVMPRSGSEDTAFVECYYDLLPTNCVSMDYCGERHSTTGKNLAVFYESCTYNCLFCQNWHYRTVSGTMSVGELVSRVDEETACICYFGGDPTPQIMHALNVAKRVDVRVCWETNGAFSRNLARRVGRTAFASGGTIKFDLKAYSDSLHYALCGASNRNTLSNFTYIHEQFHRREPPILVASSLLVPGYIDEKEISDIAQFISALDPDIPYSLLAFHPHFKFSDLPCTSRELAYGCLEAASKHLSRVGIGNPWLLT